jgi:tryptophanyl-tRNA synthetase
MVTAKKTLVSGIKSTGTLHIGNYFGAMRQFLTLQDSYDCNIFVADLHSLTTLQNKEEMQNIIKDTVAGYLAIGLNPEKVTLYKQSDVPQVTELAWIFNCITTMPYLMRAHAFKDAEAKNKEINVGVFDYPLLMAADILIEQAHIVPVGADQKQHIEIARDTAQKFNSTFGEAFVIPEAFIDETVQTIPGIDGQKMSKSYGNIIPLFADEETLRKAVMSITTDSKGVEEPKDPATDLVFTYHKLFSQNDLATLTERYQKGGIGYKESKDILFGNMQNFMTPLRNRYEEIRNDSSLIASVLAQGGERARAKAKQTMEKVRDLVGVTL